VIVHVTIIVIMIVVMPVNVIILIMIMFMPVIMMMSVIVLFRCIARGSYSIPFVFTAASAGFAHNFRILDILFSFTLTE
jgi:hypothetical protein